MSFEAVWGFDPNKVIQAGVCHRPRQKRNVAFVLLIISVFFSKAAAWVQIGFFLFNGILGWSVKSLHRHLFPESKKI